MEVSLKEVKPENQFSGLTVILGPLTRKSEEPLLFHPPLVDSPRQKRHSDNQF